MKNARLESSFAGNSQQVMDIDLMYGEIDKVMDAYTRKYPGRRFTAEDIKDIRQEAIMNAVRSWNTYDPTKSGLKTWVSRIASNTMSDSWRNKVRRNGWTETDADDLYEESLDDENYNCNDCESDVNIDSVNESYDEDDEYDCASYGRKRAIDVQDLQSDDDPFSDLIRNEQMEWLNSCLACLPKNVSFVIEASLQGMKSSAIAKKLGCSTNAVDIMRTRGKKLLMQMYYGASNAAA